MSSAIGGLLLFVMVPMAATVVGGIVATFKVPSAKLRSGIQHFAAGVVFAAAAGELLPEVLHVRAPVSAALGFSLGIVLMLAVKALARRLSGVTGATGAGAAATEPQTGAGRGAATSLLVTLAIDIFIDGLLLGIGFAAGARQGLLLTAALTVELLFLGLSGAVALGQIGFSRSKSIVGVVGLALLAGIGAIAGATILGGLSGETLEAVLAFGLAALLYLVTEELLVDAHEVPETPLTTAVFFVGFLSLSLVEMLTLAPGG